MKKCLIYGLYCPFLDEPHYIGKSSTSMVRPLSHLNKSHSNEINEWVRQLKFLGYKPIIKILEECNINNVDEKELFWIKKISNNGYYLLNKSHNKIDFILNKKEYKFNDDDILNVADMIKQKRKELNYTQLDVSNLCGINRSTYIEIEKGSKKTTYGNLKKVLNVLGYKIKIEKNE